MADQQVLTSDQIIACIQEIMSGTAPSSQVGAFLFALRGTYPTLCLRASNEPSADLALSPIIR
jgi:hypothetical protein